jgi:hypothetical protein
VAVRFYLTSQRTSNPIANALQAAVGAVVVSVILLLVVVVVLPALVLAGLASMVAVLMGRRLSLAQLMAGSNWLVRLRRRLAGWRGRFGPKPRGDDKPKPAQHTRVEVHRVYSADSAR